MRSYLSCLGLLLLLPLLSLAQTGNLRGNLIDSENGAPLFGATISLKGSSFLSTKSDDQGVFEIMNVPYGKYILQFDVEGYDLKTQEFEIKESITNLGPVQMQITNPNLVIQENLPAVTLNETDLRESAGQSVAGVLTAGRDPYASALFFNFSNGRYRNRGYDNENLTLMNGIPIEDLSTSRTLFGTWSGLNDVTRSRESTYGLNPSNYTYGSLDGAFSIDSRASKQRKQFSVSYANSNRTYNNRLMMTYGSGLLQGGWAFSASMSRRWGQEAYVPGTFTDGWSWFAAVEKRFGLNHSISLTHIGANTLNGRANPAVQEAYDLAGSNFYNSNWGYQNGEARNSRIARQQNPLTVLSHEWKVNNKTEIETSLGYQYGSNSISGFDWFNATDPRPDFYRRLPSFIEDPVLKAEAIRRWEEDENYRQVNWDGIYNTNYNSFETVLDVNGLAGNNVSGRRSRYIIEDRVTDTKRFTANINYNTVINDHFTLSGGFIYQFQESENYKRVNDLLGGEFYVDLNQWAELDFPDSSEALQNNIETPNRVLKEGDRFGYNYLSTVERSMIWTTAQFKFNHIDFFVGAHASNTMFYRTGIYRNGIFADNSKGRSKINQFDNYSIRGGVTYKLNGRNYFFLNGTYETRAPLFDNVFVSPRTRNELVSSNLEDEKITSLEGGYILRAPRTKLRFTAYYTQFNDGYNVMNFWHEDFRTFVNYALSNIDRRHLGIEVGTELTLGQGWSTNMAMALGQHYYTDRMKATVTQDNNAEVLAEGETIYSKDFYFANGPQNAMMAGLTYRAKNFWTATLSGTYFSNVWIDFNPARRTVAGLALVDDSGLRSEIIDQQKANGNFMLDFFATKSWRVSDIISSFKRRNTFLVLNLGISNILNNQDFITSGFEQLRFDYTDKNPDKFPPRYFYGFGRTYFAGVIVRFN